MTELCNACNLPDVEHSTLFPKPETCVMAQARAMERLLSLIGRPAKCSYCEAPIFWVLHSNGKSAPYTPAGLNHFVNCPRAEAARQAGQEARRPR